MFAQHNYENDAPVAQLEEQRISNRMIHCDGFAYRKKDIFKSSNLSISTNPWVAGSNPVGSTINRN